MYLYNQFVTTKIFLNIFLRKDRVEIN